MEFVKINEEAIKITLTPLEAKRYMLESGMPLDDEKSKAAFGEILNRAKKEIGFRYAGGQIFAEIFDSRDGGCEIFLSYLSGEKRMNNDLGMDALLSKLKLQNQIFCFDNMESLLMASSILTRINFQKKTSAYYDDENDKFYIILEDVSKKEIKLSFLFELGKYIKSNRQDYIIERYRLICKDNAHIVLGGLR